MWEEAHSPATRGTVSRISQTDNFPGIGTIGAVRENMGEAERRREFGEEKEMVPEKGIFGRDKKK
jgi:hypothetical protein